MPTAKCPACNGNLRFRNELSGRKVKCPKCSQVVTLPEAAATAPPLTESQAAKSQTAPVDSVKQTAPPILDAGNPTVPDESTSQTAKLTVARPGTPASAHYTGPSPKSLEKLFRFCVATAILPVLLWASVTASMVMQEKRFDEVLAQHRDDGGHWKVLAADSSNLFWGGLKTTSRVLIGLDTLVAAVLWAMLVYRLWQVLHGTPQARSPGRVTALLFVPVFNLYWMFIALGGLTHRLNAFSASTGIKARRANDVLMTVYCVLCIAFLPITYWMGSSVAPRLWTSPVPYYSYVLRSSMIFVFLLAVNCAIGITAFWSAKNVAVDIAEFRGSAGRTRPDANVTEF